MSRRRQIVLSEAVAGADHVVRATLRNRSGTKVKGVICGIFLPKRLTDPITLRFQPTPGQANRLNFALLATRSSELSFDATIRFGDRRITFSSDQVWCSSIATEHRYEIPFVTDFIGEPTGFHVIHTGMGSPARLQGVSP